jgi:hypothetical protein
MPMTFPLVADSSAPSSPSHVPSTSVASEPGRSLTSMSEPVCSSKSTPKDMNNSSGLIVSFYTIQIV